MSTNGRGNRNSLSTPQLTKRNDSRSRRSVSSLNLDNTERNPNDTLFDNLMSDPVKRNMIMKLLSQERENIEKYKQNEDKKKVTKLKRNERLLHCESPTALLRRRALERNRRESDSSSTTSDSRSTKSDSRSMTSTPVAFEHVLRGVIAYVEIRSKEGDRSAGAKALMESMGATVKDHFTADVTHVIFKDGSFTTYQKAKLKKVHLVSVLWLEAVRKTNCRVSEKNYPALGTEAFDVNISQICSDYEQVVNEEKRRSRVLELLNPFSGCIKHRKTALPSELKTIQEDLNVPSATAGQRLSEVIIPTSQDWEAESIISYTSGTLPFKRNILTVPGEESDRFAITTPELTSDDDSNCGVIDGHSFRHDSSSGLDLVIFEKVEQVEKSNGLCIPGPSGLNNISNNTSSSRSASLLSRKSELNRKSSYQVVDMDLTANLNKENVNLKSRKSGSLKKTKRDSILLSNNSTNLLDEIPGNKYDTNMGKKSDRSSLPANDKLFKEPSVDLGYIGKKFHSIDDISVANSSIKISKPTRVTRSTSDLIGKKKYSVSSDETPSLRFSTSSKNTTDKTNNSRSVQDKSPSYNEEMPSLRISTSISSNDTSGKKRGSARISGEGEQYQSSHSEGMPSLRISQSSLSNDISEKRRKKNHESKSSERHSIETSGEVISVSEDMPSLRISNSSNDNLERMKTRSSKSPSKKSETKETQNNSSNNGSEKKKKGSKSEIHREVKEDRNSDGSDSLEISNDREKKKRKTSKSKENQNNQDGVGEKRQKNNLTSSNPTSSSSTSEDMPSLRISTDGSNNIVENPKGDYGEQVDSSKRICKITPISEKQNKKSSCNEDERNGEETNQSKTRESAHDLDNRKSLNEDDLTDSTKFPNLSRRSRSRNTNRQADLKSTSATSNRSSAAFKSKESNPLDESIDTDSWDSPKRAQDNIPSKKQKLADNEKSKGENKKFRKLYNLNQSVEETLKNFEWPENQDDASTLPKSNNNVVPKKTFTVNLAPIAVTPIAKKLIESRKKTATKSKKEKVATKKKEPPKQAKCLDNSKDEQKELTDEYLKKKGKTDANEESQSDNKPKRSAEIRKSQRLPRSSKRNYKETSANTDSDSDEPIRPELNRRSTFEFVQTSPTKTRTTQKNRNKKSSIACTRMHRPEVQIFMQVVKKLGCFFVEDEVTDKTTHLVVGEPKRTINLLRALARGCWILKQEWLFRSLEAEKWLPEEDFEVTDFSPSVQQCRIERQAFGSLYSMDIFENCGPIYIARSSIPRRSDLQELVRLCKGTVTNIAYNASVVVGEWVRFANVTCVIEMWILDCITFNKRKSFKHYFIKRGN